MGAANLDKMVEKNRDLLECVGGEILEICWRGGKKWRDGSGGIVIGLENLIRTGTKGCSRWPHLCSEPLVPVRTKGQVQTGTKSGRRTARLNRYQGPHWYRFVRNRYKRSK